MLKFWNLEINYEKISETLNYVLEHSEISRIETNDLVKGFHNVADVENEIYEYADIYEEYIKTCNNSVKLARKRKFLTTSTIFQKLKMLICSAKL